MMNKKMITKVSICLLLLLFILIPLGCGSGQDDGSSANGSIAEPDNGIAVPDDDDADDQSEPGKPAVLGEVGSNVGGWSHLALKHGQFIKYNLTSERGSEGWVSITVESGANSSLDITLAGNWGIAGEFSETATFTSDMTPFDFTYSLDVGIINAVSTLFLIDHIPFAEVTWEEGYRWEEGDKLVEVGATETYAGLTGRVMTYESKHVVTGEEQFYKFVINLDFPLPLFIENPAVNDTWYYELAEIDGF